MLTRTQKFRLGIFMLIGLVLVGGGISLLAGFSLLRRHDTYTIRFRQSVSGLSHGAAVNLRGVRIGRVQSIRIDPEDFRVVVVQIAVHRDTPIPKDSQAILSSHGITGIKFIEIKTGSSKELFEPGSVIPTGKSAVQTLTGKATDIAIMTEKLVHNLLSATSPENRKEFHQTVRAARDFLVTGKIALEAVIALIQDIRPAVKRSVRNFERSSYVLRRSMRHFDDTIVETGRQLRATLVTARGALEDARGLLGKRGRVVGLMNKFERSVGNVEKRILSKDVTASLTQARRSLAALQLLLVDLRTVVGQVKGNVKPMAKALRAAAEHLEEFARTIRENPASLLRPGTIKGRRLPK